ncbi:DNA cytosine methyltransferase [Marinobacterium sp. AK62]|uniref:DNA (cytosine-5-)-methyltransferase n=1 Tax=Marinobacterium alkalitolerans TaxID=1542925 RepID=A0ABS3Z7L4_9GAMM|nr:DNA cytosine methyltransferase [Marinobacterium alkalitolerans]MBP0047687.1 DNA cytosine methyltransferase [Marinobacterium alkalitolerans]
MTPVINSYFSGGGLMDIGLLQAGLQIGKSYEIDPTCCRVQADNLGEHVQQADISEKLVAGDDCDGMVFTYPCTKYSAIADIHGTRTGDELFLHALRHLAIARPEVYAVENVPGMRAFPVVMEAMTQMPDYFVQVFCPIASSTWLPQRRDRLIIIGSRRRFNWRPPEQGRQIKLADIIEQDPRITMPKAVAKRMAGEYRDRPIISDPARGDIAPTCVAHYAKDKSTRLLADKRFPLGVRPYSVREYARLQGVPDWYRFSCSDTDAYRMIGNGVSVPVGEWLGRELQRYFGFEELH